MPLSPGATFERYRIEDLVGRGGMGEVYRATDTRLGRSVALKVLRSDEEAAASTAAAGGAARLLREARSAAAFNHPNSVAIYELGEAEGIPYIAMEYVQGTSLRLAVGDSTIPLATKLGWLVDAARALHAAHKAGLVHRDIKPSNIMVSDDGVVKVLDFGLAKPLTKKIDPSGFQTQMGQVLGTPKYMAPEQLDGEPPNAKADQFAFGLVAYEVLSGRYAGGPLAPVPPSLETIVPALSAEIGRAVTRMMARRPDERFPTLEDAANALRSAPAPSASPELMQMPAAAKRPSDAPTREVKVVHRTEPIPSTPSRSWAKTMPLAQQSPVIPPPAPSSASSLGPSTPPRVSLPVPHANSLPPSLRASGMYPPPSGGPISPRAPTPLPLPASNPPKPGGAVFAIVAVVVIALLGAGALAFRFLHH